VWVWPGSTISPPGPQKSGYALDGWYRDAGLSANSKCDFAADAVTAPLTLYAKWNFAAGSFAAGDTGPAGGVIFFVSPNGFPVDGTTEIVHYFEAAPADIGVFAMASGALPNGINTPGTDTMGGVTILYGRRNTATIIAEGKSAGVLTPAATACDNYVHGGKDDWHLPNSNELLEVLRIVSNASGTSYWSSRMNSSNGAQAYYVPYPPPAGGAMSAAAAATEARSVWPIRYF